MNKINYNYSIYLQVINLKKVIIILFIVSLSIILTKHDNEILIPDEAIRFRIIANSNSLKDQNEKLIIKKNLENEIYTLINDNDNINDVRKTLKNNLENIEHVIKKYNVPYDINYGNNHFPAKTYKNVVYPEGDYESLVITLGEGLGENFWCVLFPPLCLIEEDANTEDVEYDLYVNKLINKF